MVDTPNSPDAPTNEDSDAVAKPDTVTQDNFEEGSPAIEYKNITGPMANWPRFSFLTTNIDVAGSELKGNEGDEALFQFYTPRAQLVERVLDNEGSWQQHIRSGDRVIGPVKPRLRSTGGHATGRAALELVRRNSGNGGSITFQLIHTGITVTAEPAKESRFIDLEFSLQHQATQVGMSNTGLLLNARSGVFSEALVRFALDHIISTNYPVGADALADTLLDIVDPLDYGTLIWSVLATKFANGHPWEFRCPSEECKATHEAVINFARMLWVDKSALTEKQIQLLANNQTSITNDILVQYQEEFKTPSSSNVVLEDGSIIVLGRGNLRTYLESAKRWVDDIERAYTKSMSSYTTKARRTEYLDGQVQARRMLKYEHLVKEIKIPADVEGEYIVIDDAETIHDVLIEYSTLSTNASVFEAGADQYINDSTIAVVGYPEQICNTCGFKPPAKYGRHRAIVPIAIDRLLFTLVRQRNMVMSAMANV